MHGCGWVCGPLSPAPAVTYVVGQRVQANWLGYGTWWDARVTAANYSDNSYDIQYDSDGSLEPSVTTDRLRMTTTAAPPPPSPLRNTNDCNYNYNGRCDDGGTGSRNSLCECGTDRTDCGYRNPQLPCRAGEIVPAKEITLVLKAMGTVEEYEAKADSVKASLRQELQCFSPACVLTVTVEAGSVILTVVATDTAGGASQVELAAVALQAKPLDVMSSVLGIIIEEAPAAPSVIEVQVRVTRLAPPSPPPSGADQRAATEKKRLVVGLAGGAASIVAAFALLYVLMRRVWGLPRPPRISQSHMPVEGRPLPLPPPKLPLAVEAVALGEGEAPPAYGVAVARGGLSSQSKR